MKPVYKKHLKKTALIWGGCFVVFLIVYVALLAPQRRAKRLVEKELAEKKQMYESARKAADEETKAALHKQVQEMKSRLDSFVVDAEDSANLSFDIMQIAKEKRVSSFSVKNKEQRGGLNEPDWEYISENSMVVKFTGNFIQFATFLNALERNRPVVFVDEFSMTRSKSGELGHEASMDLSVFVRKRGEDQT
jgi:Tfp pilus assembly protein PilO